MEKPKNLGKLVTDIVIARNERGEYEGLAIKRYDRRHVYGERSEKQFPVSIQYTPRSDNNILLSFWGFRRSIFEMIAKIDISLRSI